MSGGSMGLIVPDLSVQPAETGTETERRSEGPLASPTGAPASAAQELYQDPHPRQELPGLQEDLRKSRAGFSVGAKFLMTEILVINTRGAARQLGCSETWIHKLVAASKLKAYIYDANGMLIERNPKSKRQGQGLYFRAEEVRAYHPAVRRRPRGSKNRLRRTPS